jgi:hypothetical protein
MVALDEEASRYEWTSHWGHNHLHLVGIGHAKADSCMDLLVTTTSRNLREEAHADTSRSDSRICFGHIDPGVSDRRALGRPAEAVARIHTHPKKSSQVSHGPEG